MILTDMLLGLIPAGLIVLAGILISNASSSEFKKRNLLLYWLGVGVLSLLAMWIAAQLTSLGGHWPLFPVSVFLTPSLLGVLALILINLGALLRLRGRALFLASLLGLLTAALIIALWDNLDGLLFYILPGALILSLTWAAARKTSSLPIVLSLLVLALLAVLDPYSTSLKDNLPYWLTFIIEVLIFSLPWSSVALAGIMISAGLNKFSRSQNEAGDEAVPVSRFPAYLRYALAGLLLSFLAYRIYWSSIWDNTRDGLAGLFLAMPASLVAIGVGMVVSMKNARGRRLYGVAFAILVPIFIFGAFQRGWDVDYHALTEARAARIHTALERFHHRNGRYPDQLVELVPRDLLYVPQPVIFHGSGWCYQSREDGYRLGAVYREYFGTPLSIKIYASDGEILDESRECTQQLSALKALYEPAPFFEQEINAPTEAALPTSQAHADGEKLEPVLHAEFLSWGDWSPDDRYLPISQVVSSQGEYFTALSFLDIESGEVCCAGQQFPVQSTPWAPRLRQHFAWTPLGNLLYLTPMGDLVELNPGVAGAASWVEDMQEPFVSIAAYHQETGRVLLQTAAAYWLMDSVSRSIRQIEAVKPNPDELHWDNSAWSPHGEWLATSHLNGRVETEGSTLYVLSGENGRLERSLPMNAPPHRAPPGSSG